jgi:hypothetical protein
MTSRSVRAIVAIFVTLVLLACLRAYERTQHHCYCYGTCKPNPCLFAWDPKTGQVDWSRLTGAASEIKR